MELFIIGQVVSIFSGFFLLKSMRANEKSKFLILNSTSNLLGCVSMIVLGAYAAAIGPIVLTVQGIVTHTFEKKGKKQPKYLLLIYILLNILGGLLTVNSLVSILPVISSSLASVMLMCKEVKTSRKINLISSILALPYLLINKAYVSALIFGSSFINTLDAIFKLDYKKEDIKEDKIRVEKETLDDDGERTLSKDIQKENKFAEPLNLSDPVYEETKATDEELSLNRVRNKSRGRK